jgi:hypothetical protein
MKKSLLPLTVFCLLVAMFAASAQVPTIAANQEHALHTIRCISGGKISAVF